MTPGHTPPNRVRAWIGRAARSLPPTEAGEGDQVEELRAEIDRLREAAERRGAGPEGYQPPKPKAARRLVEESGLFDEDWYAAQLDETAPRPKDLLRHFMSAGAAQGLSPHPAFQPDWYSSHIRPTTGYAHRSRVVKNPLVHYLAVGARRRLSPHPAFDAERYVDEHPAAGEEPFGPLVHFLRGDGDSALDVTVEVNPAVAQWLADPVRRDRDEFLTAARAAAEMLHGTRGHLHLKRDHTTFDLEEEARVKESVLSGADPTTRPLVSVIIPTKDRAAVIGTAVASVIDQTYDNWELLVVDDGSSDDSDAVLASFTDDPRVRVLRHEAPRGVAAARNTGLAAASGDYIAYLNSDHTWRPDFLELMVAFMTSGRHRVAYAMSALIEDGGESRALYRGMPFHREALKERNYIDCIVLVHERSLLEEVGSFDETLRRHVDWDLFVRLADSVDFAFLPVIATEYDAWATRTDRITTDEPAGFRFVVRQRALVDWAGLSGQRLARAPGSVSLVVAATGSADLTASAVRRALATADSDIEVVVVDSRLSNAESVRLFLHLQSLERTRLVRMTEKLPMELARNVGAAHASGETLVFLAETAWCEPGWETPLVSALVDHAAVQPLTLAHGGSVWSAGLHFLDGGHPVHAGRGLAGDAPEVRSLRRVDAVAQAGLAVRADQFIAVEGFDVTYADHYAGGELSLRLAAATGLPLACTGDSEIALRSVDDDPTTPQVPERFVSMARDNDRFQQSAWGDRESLLTARLAEDGLALAGVHGDGAAAPTTPLLVHDRSPRPLRWAIKIGAPDVHRREGWGDWHFAQALRDSLERLGHDVSIDCREEWYRPTVHLDDVTLVLRGLGSYRPNPLHTNAIWVISHPDQVTVREVSGYDLAFGASARWCERINRRVGGHAQLLLQCTDHRRFHPVDPDPTRQHELLAVANARGGSNHGVRPAVAAALAAGVVPSVYGERWDRLLPDGAWKGIYVPNDELPAVYAAAGAVLNDHWQDMRDEGLLSNRLFDLAACDARVISDYLPEIDQVFGDPVLTYSTPEDIPRLIALHRDESEERRAARVALGERVRREHTFDARAQLLSDQVAAVRAKP
ncbi:glycosyltransferase [Nocardioides jensenii]|uniref:glycosyltransferase n=1 Tax=Nocardioides jensenii TaxID=1843 RepID=UPI00082A0EEA|nr:glycosyltransferase [Nocardioides jensenii]